MENSKKEVYNKDGKLLGYWTAISMNDDIDVVFMEPNEYKKYERTLKKKTPEQKREYEKEYRNRPEVKERRQITNNIYAIEHKEERKTKDRERTKIYYENNKEKLRSKLSCECGSVFSYNNRHTHMKTKKHLEFMNNDKHPPIQTKF